jgi:hypothetical protein
MNVLLPRLTSRVNEVLSIATSQDVVESQLTLWSYLSEMKPPRTNFQPYVSAVLYGRKLLGLESDEHDDLLVCTAALRRTAMQTASARKVVQIAEAQYNEASVARYDI